MGSALGDLVDARARAKLRPAEITDATFTLSNLGMFDVSVFTAIITPPQVATWRPRVRSSAGSRVDGVPTSLSRMTVTLSADHRAVDGADAARCLRDLQGALESAECSSGARPDMEAMQ